MMSVSNEILLLSNDALTIKNYFIIILIIVILYTFRYIIFFFFRRVIRAKRDYYDLVIIKIIVYKLDTLNEFICVIIFLVDLINFRLYYVILVYFNNILLIVLLLSIKAFSIIFAKIKILFARIYVIIFRILFFLTLKIALI